MSTIEVDDQVLDALGRRARPFVDLEPNDVLRALLGLDQADQRPSGRRAPKGSTLDRREYEIPILRALDERGGRAAAREVIDRVGTLVGDRLTALDKEEVETGKIRWENRVQFVRLRMKERGLLRSDSPRGIWEMTAAGRELLDGHAARGRG